MCALEQAFVLEVGDVFVHGGERAQAQSAGNLLVRRRVAVLLREAGEEVDNLFLPPCYSHAEIVANKKRIATVSNDYPFDLGTVQKMDERLILKIA